MVDNNTGDAGHDPGGGAGDAGYVTVEAAIVATALTVVVGVIVAGIVTVVGYLGTVDLARDAARAAALDPGAAEAAARQVVAAADADAGVTVTGGGAVAPGSAGTVQTLTVDVTRPGRLFDISAGAVIVVEPSTATGDTS
ncbi:MAG: hypothetical protein L0K27_04015 [Corynebacterium nuruki]|nr:hypothetical protein [Corynebacterium nuruki]